jgi:YggT family protein
MAAFFTNFLVVLITILQIAIIGRALISWFPVDPANPLVRVLTEITEPVLAPLRRVIPRFGMIDLTPMVAIIVLSIAQQALLSG